MNRLRQQAIDQLDHLYWAADYLEHCEPAELAQSRDMWIAARANLRVTLARFTDKDWSLLQKETFCFGELRLLHNRAVHAKAGRHG
jgi:hypothetical protein